MSLALQGQIKEIHIQVATIYASDKSLSLDPKIIDDLNEKIQIIIKNELLKEFPDVFKDIFPILEKIKQISLDKGNPKEQLKELGYKISQIWESSIKKIIHAYQVELVTVNVINNFKLTLQQIQNGVYGENVKNAYKNPKSPVLLWKNILFLMLIDFFLRGANKKLTNWPEIFIFHPQDAKELSAILEVISKTIKISHLLENAMSGNKSFLTENEKRAVELIEHFIPSEIHGDILISFFRCIKKFCGINVEFSPTPKFVYNEKNRAHYEEIYKFKRESRVSFHNFLMMHDEKDTNFENLITHYEKVVRLIVDEVDPMIRKKYIIDLNILLLKRNKSFSSENPDTQLSDSITLLLKNKKFQAITNLAYAMEQTYRHPALKDAILQMISMNALPEALAAAKCLEDHDETEEIVLVLLSNNLISEASNLVAFKGNKQACYYKVMMVCIEFNPILASGLFSISFKPFDNDDAYTTIAHHCIHEERLDDALTAIDRISKMEIREKMSLHLLKLNETLKKKSASEDTLASSSVAKPISGAMDLRTD
jgi:hypothetical protein